LLLLLFPGVALRSPLRGTSANLSRASRGENGRCRQTCQ
jgi:hypothetical protein